MNSSEVYQEKIDERIDALMQTYLRRLRLCLPKSRRATGRVPGAAVMVRKGNEIIHLKCYGSANLETGGQLTTETIFDLGSVSKQCTAFAARESFSAAELDT